MTNGHEPYYSIARTELLQDKPVALAPCTEEKDVVATFFTELMQGYNDPALFLEIRPAYPAWRQAELYPDMKAPDGWQFRTPIGAREWFPLTERGLLAASKHAHGQAKSYETYYGVLPRNNRSGQAVDVPMGRCFWCDIDGGNEGVDGALARLEAATRSGHLPEPHVVIVSGGGLHVYWWLSEPVPLPDDKTRNKFKKVLQRLCSVIGGESPGAHADTSRAEVASLLRVPGTFNFKKEGEPRPVRLLRFDPDREAFSLTWWRANLPALPAPINRPYVASPVRPDSIPIANRLQRWAQRPHPEGQRHKSLVSDAAWMVRDLHLPKEEAERLLMQKAEVSVGTHPIQEEEVRRMIQWS